MKEGSSAREGAVILKDGVEVGKVCSGGYSPSLKHPIGMAYVKLDAAQLETSLEVNYRGKTNLLTLCKMPFVPTRYFK